MDNKTIKAYKDAYKKRFGVDIVTGNVAAHIDKLSMQRTMLRAALKEVMKSYRTLGGLDIAYDSSMIQARKALKMTEE